ncbi:hypothetical protein VNO77_20985 [Canavalia gladiata]|uniref:Uncharacterized protein n=1 Tax=Canavalia gladiata TaxID=3824 RepID=A0AAN9LVB0_CANGL
MAILPNNRYGVHLHLLTQVAFSIGLSFWSDNTPRVYSRKFNTIPGLTKGHAKPDYATSVKMATDTSIKEMDPPEPLSCLRHLSVGW